MILQACLNGARGPGEHPALPLDPASLAADAKRVVGVGANELHLHVRGAGGGETLDPAAVSDTLAAVRAAVPGTLIGISTGAWIEGDANRTRSCISGWRHLPDHASVNLGEPDAPAVIELLRKCGVGIEAGLASAGEAERLLSLGVGPACLRILVELDTEATMEAAKTSAMRILATLAPAAWRKPILLHGFNVTAWPMLEFAAKSRCSARIGLEDVLTMPDGTLAADNAALVMTAARLMRSALDS